MISISFYKLNEIEKDKLKFVVIAAQYKGKWIVVRHKERSTWEIPGGHIEEFEEVDDAASRELFEETGALDFILTPIDIYSVSYDEGCESYGKLYYADVKKISKLPELEIAEIRLVDRLPEALTYPDIQPKLLRRVIRYKKVD